MSESRPPYIRLCSPNYLHLIIVAICCQLCLQSLAHHCTPIWRRDIAVKDEEDVTESTVTEKTSRDLEEQVQPTLFHQRSHICKSVSGGMTIKQIKVQRRETVLLKTLSWEMIAERIAYLPLIVPLPAFEKTQ